MDPYLPFAVSAGMGWAIALWPRGIDLRFLIHFVIYNALSIPEVDVEVIHRIDA